MPMKACVLCQHELLKRAIAIASSAPEHKERRFPFARCIPPIGMQEHQDIIRGGRIAHKECQFQIERPVRRGEATITSAYLVID